VARGAAESARASAESARRAAEEARRGADEMRRTLDEARRISEMLRRKAEESRIAAERIRRSDADHFQDEIREGIREQSEIANEMRASAEPFTAGRAAAPGDETPRSKRPIRPKRRS
jgi:hypothetical protein